MATDKKTFEERAAAAPTQLHKDFAEWIFVQTGVKVDAKAVQLVATLRHDYQRSEENQKSLAARKKAAADKAAKAKADKIAKAKATLAKLQAEIEAATAPSTPAVKPAAKTAAKKTTPSKAAPVAPAESAKAPEAPAKAATPARRTRRTTAAKTTAPATK